MSTHSAHQPLGPDPSPGDAARPLRTVRKRDGREAEFDAGRIAHAIEMAFRAETGSPYPDPLPAVVAGRVDQLSEAVVTGLRAAYAPEHELHIEEIQDVVERQLMTAGEYAVARRYILYREARAARREGGRLQIAGPDGQATLLERSVIKHAIAAACATRVEPAEVEALYRDTLESLYPGIPAAELAQAMIMAARARIERDPAYAYVAARFLLDVIYAEVLGRPANYDEMPSAYSVAFKAYVEQGVAGGILSPKLLAFDLDRLGGALAPERDLLFKYMGLQTLYDRYLIQREGRRIEAPQAFWMRVAMGLALAEPEPERDARAIEFYDLLSQFLFCSSTPTLFNAGTLHPQLSSCYLTTIEDDLGHIFKSLRDDALLSKWSGGLGNDWTNVRALGSPIKGTHGRSQGVIPFLKVANDTAIAVNQGGRRRGAICAYLETWHLDIEEFLELRRNTGDERRRTHDMNTANWIPDLFMKRVLEDGEWTLFSPADVPDLHDLYGAAFEARYLEYERLARGGEIALHKRVSAVELWRKMLTMLFETGHPWLTFKDPANVRSPQDHVGVVHNSNLCTEILLHTSADEVAVCNLGSINLARHVADGHLDVERLARTVRTAVRMLDNVIDINFYPIPEARRANLQHRPVGLGLMGFQDALYMLGLSYASPEAVAFADRSMELISYHALLASSELAAERGAYPSYSGSKWARGLLPIDTLELLRKERGGHLDVDLSASLDWAPVRAAIEQNGLRNSNTMAIAPTATIANIQGVSQSIEPTYRNLYVKSNLSGEFTVINEYLVDDLKALGLWDAQMIDDLKYFDGSLLEIERVPAQLKERYRSAFEIEPEWLIECASRRQKWIDMGQSLNLYVAEAKGPRLSRMYLTAWEKGLKTTYYLRSLGATQIEKSTLDINARAIQPRWMKAQSASSEVEITREAASCRLDDPDCEACQ